jgi:Protein of unknown function (DUF707)
MLVVLRAGDMSLHPGWLEGAPADSRTWDLHLSYYGDDANPFSARPADVTLSFEKGTKATGTVDCLDKFGGRIADYDWVWLPDDDLAADLPTINRFFGIVQEYDLELAQPALGRGSYLAHEVTAQRPHLKLRYTNFVEVMAVCFSKRALQICRPYLGATVSSLGVDYLFPKLLGYPKRAIAIVDETAVVHTRPAGGGPNHALTRQLGIDPGTELEHFLRHHQLTRDIRTWGGIDLDGKLVTALSQVDGAFPY